MDQVLDCHTQIEEYLCTLLPGNSLMLPYYHTTKEPDPRCFLVFANHERYPAKPRQVVFGGFYLGSEGPI
uniref:COesterase domain-containing protein n=1 Tax=Steinernema glaseri TaxID=37863 RepID=A0A1I7YWK7_9BILA